MKRLTQICNQMYQEGLKDEEFVMNLTNKTFGCKTYKSEKDEDVYQHIDFWCEVNNKRYGIDVKGLKKQNRNDTEYDDSIHWVELLNTQGNPGWVYGKCVYIAFMTKKSVLYVPRKQLCELVEQNTKNKEVCFFNPKECYQPYQRKGRKDKVIKVPTDDLRKIAKHEIIFNI